MECVVAVAILAVGLVSIYRVLLGALDREDYLSHRLYAGQLLQSQADYLVATASNSVNIPPADLAKTFKAVINNRPMEFNLGSETIEFKDLPTLQQVALSLSWDERGRRVQLQQTICVLLKPSETP